MAVLVPLSESEITKTGIFNIISAYSTRSTLLSVLAETRRFSIVVPIRIKTLYLIYKRIPDISVRWIVPGLLFKGSYKYQKTRYEFIARSKHRGTATQLDGVIRSLSK